MPQNAGAPPTSSGRVPPFDLKRIAARPARTSSALSTWTNISPLTPRFSARLMFSAAFVVSAPIFGVFTISGAVSRGERRPAQRARFRRRLDEVGDRTDAAIDAAFEGAAEEEIGCAVRQRFTCELARQLWRYIGRRRRAGASAPGRIGRPVHAEHRLLLFEQLDDVVDPPDRLRLSRHQHAQRARMVPPRTHDNTNKNARVTVDSLTAISTRRRASPARRRPRAARRRRRARRIRS